MMTPIKVKSRLSADVMRAHSTSLMLPDVVILFRRYGHLTDSYAYNPLCKWLDGPVITAGMRSGVSCCLALMINYCASESVRELRMISCQLSCYITILVMSSFRGCQSLASALGLLFKRR